MPNENIDKGTLITINGSVARKYYPKTSADMVEYNENMNIKEKIDSLSSGSISQLDSSVLNSIVQDENYVHTDNNFTDEYKEKLDDIDQSTGDLDDLKTTEKGNIINAINEIIDNSIYFINI